MSLQFNTEPYFDDYKAEKDFYRILFRPSYAVQARELTQLQTILQNQVSRFGDHVFKNGSQVIPGSVNVDNKVHFIKLEQFTGTIDVTTYIETFKNKIITGETSGVKMRVLDTTGGGAVVDELGIPTLYCKVEGTADDGTTNRLVPGENIIAYAVDNKISSNFRLKEDQLTDITGVVRLTGNAGETATTYSGIDSSDVLGYGYSVSVGAGIYYIDGIFVRNDDLKLYVGRFSNTPSCRVGFKVTEQTITPEDDETILDNATGSYNFAAPGAHRYKITLSLVKLDLVATDTFKFVELVRIVNGRVQQKIQAASYAELEKTLARRTYDESGNYEVNKFKLSVREHNNDGVNQGVYAPLGDNEVAANGVTYGDKNKFVLVVDPGKAYIQGYEVESSAANFIEFDKARIINGNEGNHVQRIGNQTIGLNIGNYVEVKNLYGSPNINTFEQVYLVNKLQRRQAIVTCTINAGTGALATVSLVDGGSGYWNGSTSTFSFTTVTSGTNKAVLPRISGFAGTAATLTVTVTNGTVTGVVIANAGTGYSSTTPPEIRLVQHLYFNADSTVITNSPTGTSPSPIVGTARTRAIQIGDIDTNPNKTTYKLGLFDIQMFNGKSFERDVKSVVGVLGGLNVAADINPTTWGVSGLVTSAATNSTTITASGSSFLTQVQAGDIVFFNGVMAGQVASVDTNYQLTLTSNSLVAVSGQPYPAISIFTTTLHEASFEPLLFPVGQTYVKTLRGYSNGSDTAKNTTVVVRRKFDALAAVNNKVQFELRTTGESFLSNEELSNFVLISYETNLPVKLTTSDTSQTYITFADPVTKKIVIFNNVPDGQYYLIASVQQTDTAGQEKIKVLNTVDGSITITDKRTLNLNSIPLGHGDILRLVSVELTPETTDGNGNYVFNSNNVVDVTDRYTLDNGQRSTYYTYGSINLKPGQKIPNGAIRIKYHFFTVSSVSNGNYFSVDSYQGIDYADIPSFFIVDSASNKKIEYALSDVIDFRPILTTSNGFIPQLPKIGSDMVAPRANYVGRIDKVILDSFGKFNVIKGVPAFAAKEPEDPKEGLVLGTLRIPPYTKSVTDIVITQRDNRRYTMRDIGRLERRISNLEYYVTLSLLEKDTADLQVTDVTTGLDRFKNGFIVDQFTGHGIGDVKNEDYCVSVDAENRILRPSHYTNALELVEDLASGTDRGNKTYQKTGDLITLPYTEQTYIFNNNATRTMDIHAISMGAFKGQISLFPEGDNWKSVNRKPDLVAVDDNNYDAIKYLTENVIGTKWNEWQTNWTAGPTVNIDYETKITDRTRSHDDGWIVVTGYEASFTDWTGYQTRDGVNTSMTSTGVNTQSYGDRVVDMSYIPYMRSRPVTFVAENLKGKTRFYPFFDNVSVAKYTKPSDIFTLTRVGTSLMSFKAKDLQNNILQDDPRREYNGSHLTDIVGENGGRIEPAFGVGDILTNAGHVPTNIVSIANISGTPAATFSLVVGANDNIKPGNHVLLYNLDYHKAVDLTRYEDYSDTIIPAGTGITNHDNSSKQLNLRVFKVTAVSGGNITLASLDGSLIQPFDAYSTGSYNSNSGKLYRLRASGVAVFGGTISSSDTIGPIVQDVYMVNIKNGFAVGEELTGSVAIGTTGSFNRVTTTQINGSNITSVAPTMKTTEDTLITNSDGTAVGVFYIPETNEQSFRTGERTFKLTDNSSNSGAAFDSTGSAVYYAQGISLDKERTIVSTRAVEFVQSTVSQDSRDLGLPPQRRTTTSLKTTYQYAYDPLAQTFTINSPGGIFLTSIDLYFIEAGRRPISIELRPTDNGVPSSTKTVPMSRVTHTPAEIAVSNDSSSATNFKFKSPIYLQDGETYSFVVMTDEPGAQLFVSEMGQTDILTGNTIAGQPLTGSLYASQNAQEWEIHTLLDIKFVMNSAKFNINANPELYLRTNPPEMLTLPTNPLRIKNGTSLIRVDAPKHGLLAGQKVTFVGFPEGLYGANSTNVGIPHTLLNATHTVYQYGVDVDSFIIDLQYTDTSSGQSLLKGTVNDFITGQYGGTGISCTRGFLMDLMYMKSSDLLFPDTSINYYVKTMDTNGTYTSYLPFIVNNNFSFTSRMNVPGYENYQTSNGAKVPPVSIKAVLSSSNENISPVIDLQQLSVYAISNLINNVTTTDINVDTLDTRILLQHGDIKNTDIRTTLTGTAQAATNSTALSSGSSGITLFLSQVVAGNTIWRDPSTTYTVTGTGTITSTLASKTVTGTGTNFVSASMVGTTLTNTSGTTIGVVASVESTTSLTLVNTAALAVSSAAFKVVSAGQYVGTVSSITDDRNIVLSANAAVAVATTDVIQVRSIAASLVFENDSTSTYGVIRTNIDTADNLLSSAGIGKSITIYGVASGVDGTYTVRDVQIVADKTVYAGNIEGDVTKIILESKFSTTATIDMITDPDFYISIQDRYIADTSPFGCTNSANYITRTLSLTQAAEAIKVIFDANIVKDTLVKVYYRTWTGDIDLKKVRWVDTGFKPQTKDSAGNYIERDPAGQFFERDIDVTGMPPFNNVQIKIVMKSTNPVNVPKIKNLRLIALS